MNKHAWITAAIKIAALAGVVADQYVNFSTHQTDSNLLTLTATLAVLLLEVSDIVTSLMRWYARKRRRHISAKRKEFQVVVMRVFATLAVSMTAIGCAAILVHPRDLSAAVNIDASTIADSHSNASSQDH